MQKKNWKSLAAFSFIEWLLLIWSVIKTKCGFEADEILARKSYFDGLINVGFFPKYVGKGMISISTSNQSGPVMYVRKKSSDLQVFDSVWVRQDYGKPVDLLKKNVEPNDKPTIIDAGANIGLTSLYLNKFFPEAKIIALEPDPGNFKALSRNLAFNKISNILPIEAALWPTNEKVYLNNDFRDGKEWSISVSEKKDNRGKAVVGMTIPKLMENHNLDYIDLLKIDIEGGEKQLFENTAKLDWLSKVKLLVIEIHDELEIREGIESTLKIKGFSLSSDGYNTICINDSL